MLVGLVLALCSCGTTRNARPAATSKASTAPTAATSAADTDDIPDVSPLDDIPAEDKAKLTELFGREGTPTTTTTPFATLEGAVTGAVGNGATVKLPCKSVGSDGERECQGELAMATVGEATASMSCVFLNSSSVRLAHTLTQELGEQSTVLGPSEFSVEAANDGIVANLAVDYFAKDVFYTLKVSVLFARGYLTFCSNHDTGLRTTFRTATKTLFTSLRFAPRPSAIVTYAAGYRDETDGVLTGFRVVTLVKTNEGSTENRTYFARSPKKFLAIGDRSAIVFRNKAGAIIRQVALSGDTRMDIYPTDKPLVNITLTRKGVKHDWKLPTQIGLNTEAGLAAAMLQLADGKRESIDYSLVDADDVGPKIYPVRLTRRSDTTLNEISDGRANLLTLDAKGYVVLQTSDVDNSPRIAVYAP